MLVNTSKFTRPIRWAIKFYMGPGPLKRVRKLPLWLIIRAAEAHYLATGRL